MIGLCKRLIRIFGKEDRVRFVFFFLGMLLSSALEVVGIGLILPFIALLGRPQLLTSKAWLSHIYQASHLQSFNQFMAAMAIGIALVFLIKNAVIFFMNFWQTRFIFQKQTYFVSRLFHAYLMSPYSFHLRRDIGRLKHSLENVQSVMNGVVLQVFNMATEMVLVVFLFLFLLIVHPFLTFIVIVFLGASMFLFFSFLKRNIKKWGQLAHHHGILRTQAVEQGLGSFKEAKLWGKELFFSKKYQFHRQEDDRYSCKNDVMMKSVRLFIETIVVTLIMSSMAIFLMTGHSPEKILMTLSMFAIVAVRLMPSMNRISTAWGGIKFSVVSFDAIYDDLMNCERMEEEHQELDQGEPIIFRDKIKMNKVSFFYSGVS